MAAANDAGESTSGASPYRVGVLGPLKATAQEASTRGLAAALKQLDARPTIWRAEQLGELSPQAIDVFVLDATNVGRLNNVNEATQALEAVTRAGVNVLVLGNAAAWATQSRRVSELLGRQHGVTVAQQPDDSVALAIVNQSHPLTQCLTHLVLDETRPTAVGEIDTGVLGVSVDRSKLQEPRLTPALWSQTAKGAHMIVFAVEHVTNKPSPLERLVEILAARTIQWSAETPITVELPAQLPLAASRLGPKDRGIVPGLPPLEGFFRGREVAPFMSFHGAPWLLRTEREAEEKPEEVLQRLQLKKGSTVVDLGAGNGYFSLRMARLVGPTGKVLAVDIQQEMLDLLSERSRKAGIENIVPVLATPIDPRLPERGVDLAIMVDVYHELSDPVPVLAGLRRALRPKDSSETPGRLALVEYRGEDPTVRIKPLHRMTLQQIRAELAAEGFQWQTALEFLPHQRVVIFTPK